MQKIKRFALPIQKFKKIGTANAKNKKNLLCSYWTLYLTVFYSQYLHYFNAVSFAIYWLSCSQLFHCKQKDI